MCQAVNGTYLALPVVLQETGGARAVWKLAAAGVVTANHVLPQPLPVAALGFEQTRPLVEPALGAVSEVDQPTLLPCYIEIV
jgi:hypothetical protein